MSEYKWKPFTLLVSAEEVKGNEMKIEAGKYYKTRDGRKAQVVKEIDFHYEVKLGENIKFYVFGSGRVSASSDDYHNHILDLVAEWQDEAPSPIRTVTRREIVAGVYGIVKVGSSSTHKVMGNVCNIAIGASPNHTLIYSAEELREAAHILNQIAEVLQENGK